MYKGIFKSIIDRIKSAFAKSREGSEVDYIAPLPAPLSPEEESKMLELYATGDESAGSYLVEHNLRLVVYIAKRFDNTGIDIEELISVGTMGLIKAVKGYNSGKNIKLATFASRCIENEILMYLRKMVRVNKEVSLDEPLNVDFDGNKLLLGDVLSAEDDGVIEEYQAKAEKDTLKNLFEGLDTREREIICMRYGLYGAEEKTQKEIADMFCISQSYISRLEKRTLGKLREKFEILG